MKNKANPQNQIEGYSIIHGISKEVVELLCCQIICNPSLLNYKFIIYIINYKSHL